eukprot:SAG31_NODE_8472_length_1445_cov_0.879643_1_plen_35_part_10
MGISFISRMTQLYSAYQVRRMNYRYVPSGYTGTAT